MRLLCVALSLSVARYALAQTTRPSEPPPFELKPEVQARFDALSKASTTRPYQDPLDRRLTQARANSMRFQAGMNAAYDAKAFDAAASSELSHIDQQLRLVQAGGVQTEQRLAQLKADRLTQIQIASAPTYSTVQGTISEPYGGPPSIIRGTIRSTGDSAVAQQLIENRFAEPIARAEMEIEKLYAAQQQLLQRRGEIILAQRGARQIARNAGARAQDAARAAARVEALERATAANAAASDWATIEATYPGADVRRIWAESVADASGIIGSDNPKLRELASSFFTERAAIAAGARSGQSTRPPRDLLAQPAHAPPPGFVPDPPPTTQTSTAK
jgi:hypothetical protein